MEDRFTDCGFTCVVESSNQLSEEGLVRGRERERERERETDSMRILICFSFNRVLRMMVNNPISVVARGVKVEVEETQPPRSRKVSKGNPLSLSTTNTLCLGSLLLFVYDQLLYSTTHSRPKPPFSQWIDDYIHFLISSSASLPTQSLE